jgi:hypothetical protein
VQRTGTKLPLESKKTMENFDELAGFRTVGVQTEFYPAEQYLNTGNITLVPICAAALF